MGCGSLTHPNRWTPQVLAAASLVAAAPPGNNRVCFWFTSRTTEPKVLLKNATKATVFLLSPGENWENQLKTENSGRVDSKWKSVNNMGFVYINALHIFIRLGSGIKFPTPNIIYQKFHANLHSRLLISSISRFSHSFSKCQGKEKVCKQFCWSLQIRPSCFWNELKTLPNDFAGSSSKNLKYIMRKTTTQNLVHSCCHSISCHHAFPTPPPKKLTMHLKIGGPPGKKCLGILSKKKTRMLITQPGSWHLP